MTYRVTYYTSDFLKMDHEPEYDDFDDLVAAVKDSGHHAAAIYIVDDGQEIAYADYRREDSRLRFLF